MAKQWKKAIIIGFVMFFFICILIKQFGKTNPERFGIRMQRKEETQRLLEQAGLLTVDPVELAQRLIQSAKGASSPVEILKRGDRKQAMERALSILEKNHIMGSLWLLLTIWACQIHGDMEIAKAGLKALKDAWKGERVGPAMTGWRGDVASFLLGDLSEVDDEIVSVASVMLEEYDKSQVISMWAKRGFFNHALKLAETERREWLRRHNFAEIADALVKANRTEEAIEMAKTLPNVSEHLFVLTKITHAMAETGKDVSSLLEEIKKEAKGLRLDSRLLSEIAFVFAKLGREEEALKLAQKVARDERAMVLSQIIKALSQRQNFERAMEILKAPEFEHGMGYWFKGEATVTIAKALAQFGKLDEAQKLAEQSRWEYFEVLIDIAKEAIKQGKHLVADEIFDKLLAEATHWHNLFRIAFAQTEASLDAALAFERAMEAVKRGIEDLDRYRLKEVAIRMASLGLTEKAMEIVKLMEKTSDRVETLANVGIRIAGRGNTQTALQYFERAFLEEEFQRAQHKADEVLEFLTKEMVRKKMLKEAEEIAQLVKTEPLRSRALAEVARAKAEIGKVQDALNLAQKVQIPKELICVAEEMAKAGKIREALSLLTRIKDIDEREQILFLLATRLAEDGKFANAFLLIKAIQQEERRMYASDRVAAILAWKGRFKEALKIAETIKDPNSRASALLGIAIYMTETREVLKVVREVLKMARAEKNVKTRSEMLGRIADILAHNGQWQEALQVAREITDEWEYLGWLMGAVEIAIAQKRPETLSLARQLRAKALRLKEKFESNTKQWALATAAKGLAIMGKAKEADKAFDEAIRTTRSIRDESVRAETLKFVSWNLSDVGRFDQALKVALEISDKHKRWEAIGDVLGKMTELSKVDEAIRYSGYLSQEERDSLLVHLAGVHHSLPIARAVKNTAKRVEALIEVAKGLCWEERWFKGKGKRKEAEKVFEEALGTAKQIPDHAQRVKKLWEIAIALANTGFYEKAVSLVESLPFMRGENLPTLLHVLADKGKKELCYRLIPLCQEDLILAYEGCLAVARLFPEHAIDIAQLILENSLEGR
ncbi:MAG: hypothetical protein NZ781_12740 [Armatimonadetes bacterium]|nr:hypothetical protein [Armatimonadota bacterium]